MGHHLPFFDYFDLNLGIYNQSLFPAYYPIIYHDLHMMIINRI
jgi:hypothetical protein